MILNFYHSSRIEYNKSKRKKYRTDPEYRKMHIKASTRWQKQNKEKVSESERKRYAKRTPQQIKKRKNYLKKLRSRK